MTSWGKDNQPHLTASKTVRRPTYTGVRLAHVSMGSDTGPGQPVTHKMLTFPTLFSLFPSLLRNYSSLKYVCTVCICMYVQNLAIGLEHINQKRWAIPHCVLESYIISPAGCDEINQVQVSFIWSVPHCESMVKLSEDNSHSSYMLTLQAGWCLTSTILLFLTTPQSRWHSTVEHLTTFVSLFGVQHTDACHVSSHTTAAPLFSQINPWFRPRSVRLRVTRRPFIY